MQWQKIAEQLVQWRRLMATGGLALLAVVLFGHVLFGNNGWLSYREKRAEYDKLQLQLQKIDEDNRRLEAQIRALKSDPKAIEKEAREQLRYAKPGEIIYLLPEQPSRTASGAAQSDSR